METDPRAMHLMAHQLATATTISPRAPLCHRQESGPGFRSEASAFAARKGSNVAMLRAGLDIRGT